MTIAPHSFVGSFVLLVIGCCVLSVSASPSGAPEAACTTMTPQHGVGWQNTTCPFEISVDKTRMYSSESLNIRLGIKGGVDVNEPAARGFIGFMAMAFDPSSFDVQPLGIFDNLASTEIKTMNCPSPFREPNTVKQNVAATHTNNGFKKMVDLVWSPPEDFLGPVIIVVTFVHEKEILWVKENSQVIQVVADPGPGETTMEQVETTTSSMTIPSSTTPSTTVPTAPTTTAATTTTEKPTTMGAESSAIEWKLLFGVAVVSFLVRNQF